MERDFEPLLHVRSHEGVGAGLRVLRRFWLVNEVIAIEYVVHARRREAVGRARVDDDLDIRQRTSETEKTRLAPPARPVAQPIHSAGELLSASPTQCPLARNVPLNQTGRNGRTAAISSLEPRVRNPSNSDDRGDRRKSTQSSGS